MAEVISQRINHIDNKRDADELRALLNGIVDGIRVVTAKLDSDAGVTDTNFTAVFDAVITKT